MRLRYLERNPAACEALRILEPAFLVEERDDRLLLLSRTDGTTHQVSTVEALLDLAAKVRAGEAGLAWRRRARSAPGGADPDLLRALDCWRRRAILAETALRSRGIATTDARVIRRIIARTLHPDAAPGSEAERALRTELFQRVWSALDRVEKRG